MSLHLTPDILEASYELLRATQPFSRWKLPHADDVEFRVTGHAGVFGSFHFDDTHPGRERIQVSERNVKTLPLLLQVLAHEMCHLREAIVCRRRAGRANHGAMFQRLAAQVCRHHDFNLETF